MKVMFNNDTSTGSNNSRIGRKVVVTNDERRCRNLGRLCMYTLFVSSVCGVLAFSTSVNVIHLDSVTVASSSWYDAYRRSRECGIWEPTSSLYGKGLPILEVWRGWQLNINVNKYETDVLLELECNMQQLQDVARWEWQTIRSESHFQSWI